MTRRTVAVGIVALALIAAVGWMSWRQFTPTPLVGTVLSGSEQAPPLEGMELTSGGDLEIRPGEVTVLYFGYVFCPDVCAVHLDTVARARSQLDPATAQKVRTVMVSVDPERDTPEALNAYLSVFDPSFEGARGSLATTEAVASGYGVYFASTGDTVDHTSTLLGIDTDGVLRVVWAPGVSAEDLAHDLAVLAS